MTNSLKPNVCRYCGEPITYSASSLRGAWYARDGRICTIASAEFEGVIAHSPQNNIETAK